MSYKLTMFDNTTFWKSKDDVLSFLLAQINGDGVNYIKLVYPDKTYFEFPGDEE